MTPHKHRELDAEVAERVMGLKVLRATGVERDDYDHCAIMPAGEFYTSAGDHDNTRLPAYSTDPGAAWDMEARVAELAIYNGAVVLHRPSPGTQQGCCLKEQYAIELLRLVTGITDLATTCMGHNNWISHRFRSDELYALAHATPEQRCRAALAVVTRKGE